MEKICVYTCITGDYDDLKKPNFIDKDVDYYCFTNNSKIESDFWKIVYIENDGLDNHFLSRKIKMLGHPSINENYDYLVWIDGDIIINCSIKNFISKNCDFKNYDFAAFKHHARNCMYDEAIACLQLKKDSRENIEKTLQFYESVNFPRNYGLYEMTVFIRKAKSKIVNETLALWFEMINKYSPRDQLSFMYCAYKTGLKIKTIDMNIWKNDWFKAFPHKRKNDFSKYRLYFGNSNNGFQIDCVYDGLYKIDGDCYSFECRVLNDCDMIEYDVVNADYVMVEDLKINKKCDVEYDCCSFEDFRYFKRTSKIILNADFRKGEKLKISVVIRSVDIDRLIESFETAMENYDSQLGQLKTENVYLHEKFDITNCELQKILNSKGWKFLEKLRRLKK